MTAPEPLTPAECDLQDFAFMPLQVARLRDSDLAATEHPEACWYAVLLWSASWHQLPAASLPNDDVVLARMCGLGRDVRTFRKHRAGALRGFVLCSDGRLYHPVVAEQANRAWSEKNAYRQRKEQRAAIAKKAASARWGNSTDEADALHDAMHEASPADASCMPDAMPKGTGTGTGISIPFSNENGATPDSDKAFWTTAKGYLGPKNASLIGKWVRDHGREATAAAISAAQVERAVDPVEFIQGRFRNGREGARSQPVVPL